MKQLLIAMSVAITIASSANAQISLEKSYQNIGTVSVHNIENEGHKYLVVSESQNSVLLYNSGHTLWKSIKAQVPSSYVITSALYASSKLFNTDNLIELIAVYIDTNTNNFYGFIVNENGTVINTFNNAAGYFVTEVNGGFKLIVTTYSTASYSDVYSLPGKLLSVKKPGKNTQAEADIYPNPMGEAATLTYSLPKGTETGSIQVYNSNGVLVRMVPIQCNSGAVIINRGELPAGVYHYTCYAAGNTSNGKSFVIE